MTEIDDYFAAQPEPQRTTLLRTWADFQAVVANGVEGMSYGMPTLKIDGKSIGSLAGFKAHCSYFPHSGGILGELTDILTPYEVSKGTLRFPIDQPLPPNVLAALVRARISQLGAK